MKIQDLDEPAGALPAAPQPLPPDHRVVMPLDAAPPIWQRARCGEPAFDLPTPRKEPT
jgi:hypothetical protein